MIEEVLDDILCTEREANLIIEEAKRRAQELIEDSERLAGNISEQAAERVRAEREALILSAREQARAVLAAGIAASEGECAELAARAEDKIDAAAAAVIKAVRGG